MSHHVIIVKELPVKTQSALRNHIALGKLVSKIEDRNGPLQCFKGNPDEAARLLSRSKIVESVIVVHVSETACGVWRNGVKS